MTIEDYQALARAHDELFAGIELDQVAVMTVRGGQQITFRWIVQHLIEENARHNGHLDIIRELIDGTTGD